MPCVVYVVPAPDGFSSLMSKLFQHLWHTLLPVVDMFDGINPSCSFTCLAIAVSSSKVLGYDWQWPYRLNIVISPACSSDFKVKLIRRSFGIFHLPPVAAEQISSAIESTSNVVFELHCSVVLSDKSNAKTFLRDKGGDISFYFRKAADGGHGISGWTVLSISYVATKYWCSIFQDFAFRCCCFECRTDCITDG